jgi:hypothetical protein
MVTYILNVFNLFADELFVVGQPLRPLANYAIDIYVLLVHENHPHS